MSDDKDPFQTLDPKAAWGMALAYAEMGWWEESDAFLAASGKTKEELRRTLLLLRV